MYIPRHGGGARQLECSSFIYVIEKGATTTSASQPPARCVRVCERGRGGGGGGGGGGRGRGTAEYTNARMNR